jgi:hypothetical protein
LLSWFDGTRFRDRFLLWQSGFFLGRWRSSRHGRNYCQNVRVERRLYFNWGRDGGSRLKIRISLIRNVAG